MVRILLFVGCLICLAACGDGSAANDRSARAPSANTGTHIHPANKDGVERKPVPAEYAARQPHRRLDDAALIAQGKTLYEDAARGNCLLCHGESGKGDGFMAKSYEDPAVADLTSVAMHESVSDQYIFWRLARPFDSKVKDFSSMNGYPAGSDEELWALVAYVRSLKGR
ncbi:MAG: cytochrome c [Planctomycetes bacterium]|nr:cytochrome c [Planctomycetota bacterium]MCB9935796.1 cytochrome c [Planctomycetota bacterium]